MAFSGNSFIFNGIPSEFYDLRIYNFSFNDPSDGVSGGDVSIYEKWLYRKNKPYFYGRYYQNPLEFDFTVGSFSNLDAYARNAIETWLLGKSTYLPLQIVQDDLQDTTFNVILSKITPVYIGNLNYAVTLHARCDSPWAWTHPIDTHYALSSTYSNFNFNYLNESAFDGYNYPFITFQICSGFSGSNHCLILTNNSDSGRIFRFDNLDELETVTVDNDKQIITSSGSSLRMTNFNKNFFRLVPGMNNINFQGYVLDFTMSASFVKVVGA